MLYFHGFPGSRIEARLLDDAARKLNVRIIGVDRPGYGKSDADKNERPGRLSNDITALADVLGLKRFSILAVSGGAPHALAVATAISTRISSVALVGGLALLSDGPATAGMSVPRRMACRFLRIAPSLIPLVAGTICWRLRRDVPATIDFLESSVPPVDRIALQEPKMRRILLDSFAEAVRSGGAGMASDTRFYLTKRKMAADHLGIPLSVWHGEMDTTVPPRMSAELAARLPHAQLFLLKDEGHYSLPLNHHRSVLERLLCDQRT